MNAQNNEGRLHPQSKAVWSKILWHSTILFVSLPLTKLKNIDEANSFEQKALFVALKIIAVRLAILRHLVCSFLHVHFHPVHTNKLEAKVTFLKNMGNSITRKIDFADNVQQTRAYLASSVEANRKS